MGAPCKRCINPTMTRLSRHLCLRVHLVDEGVSVTFKNLNCNTTEWFPRGGAVLQVEAYLGILAMESCRKICLVGTQTRRPDFARKARLPWPDLLAGAALSKRRLLTNRRIQNTIINVSQEPIIRLALRLWAANRLLMNPRLLQNWNWLFAQSRFANLFIIPQYCLSS